ncbi:hypothetical protein KAS08_02175 [Candidatus Pacearchaeota archaeon]|nr:hypothetical protein [Candidatus Pacearchaeota archaeon]
MKEIIHANKGLKRWFFFWAGIIATLAYRSIIVLDSYFTRIAWYIGTVGFILYFGHRKHIQKKRSELVHDNDLIKVVQELTHLTQKQKSALSYIIKSVGTSKVRWNSLFIFWFTLLALIVGIVRDLFF